MQQLTIWLESGGPVMYLLLFGLAPLVALSGLLHLILASRNSFLQLCLCFGLTLGTGLVATSSERGRVGRIVAMARPEERLHLAIAGYRGANRPLAVSLVIGLGGVLPYTLGEMRRSRRSAARQTDAARA